MSREATKKVALIVPPFFSVTRPSLAVGLLKKSAENAGYECDVYYPNITLAEKIGFSTYSWIAELTPPSALVGDWLFSEAAHQDHPDWSDVRGEEYFREVIFGRFAEEFDMHSALRLLEVKELVGEFVEEYCDVNNLFDYDALGFTTTFNQNCSAIAFAKHIKKRKENCAIILGGANCEGSMGAALLKNYPEIDAVCCGEGEASFVDFLNATFQKDDHKHACRKFLDRRTGASVKTTTPPPVHLDLLPIPDYQEYYDGIETSSLYGKFDPLVPFETSRGCWWGEKHHCTFCGLNGLSMKFRSKSQQRALSELFFLSEKWGNNILCVDNILDLNYFEEFLPALANQGGQISIHYEVKANLRKEQISLLANAGVTAIQPGLESFIDSVLRLMDKGSNALMNIQLLKRCKERGIFVAWNVLYGFPNENPDEYREMIELLPKLVHFDPPQFCGRVRPDRFSPFFLDPDRFGIRLNSAMAYKFVYPFSKARTDDIAYYFEMEFEGSAKIEEYEASLCSSVEQWKSAKRREPKLVFVDNQEAAKLIDSRTEEIIETLLSPLDFEIIKLTDNVISMDKLLEELKKRSFDAPQIKKCVQNLISLDVLVTSGERLLSLVVFDNDN